VLFENVIKNTKDEKNAGSRGFVSANGTFSRRNSLDGAQQEHYITSLRDVAAVITISCGAAAFFMEGFRTDVLTWGPEIAKLEGDWKLVQNHRMIKQCVLMTLVGTLEKILLFMTVSFPGLPYTIFLLYFLIHHLALPLFSILSQERECGCRAFHHDQYFTLIGGNFALSPMFSCFIDKSIEFF